MLIYRAGPVLCRRYKAYLSEICSSPWYLVSERRWIPHLRALKTCTGLPRIGYLWCNTDWHIFAMASIIWVTCFWQMMSVYEVPCLVKNKATCSGMRSVLASFGSNYFVRKHYWSAGIGYLCATSAHIRELPYIREISPVFTELLSVKAYYCSLRVNSHLLSALTRKLLCHKVEPQ